MPTSSPQYKICTRCVMDTSDPEIIFDENGLCNHCKNYEKVVVASEQRGERSAEALNQALAKIKQRGQGKKYDSIIGVSGGTDSTFVAYKIKQLGLRPLAVHFDNGWDSELAVSNIEKVLKKLDIDLYTYVMDWDEFRDLQLAFLRSSTPDSEIPTDHAITAILYQTASKYRIPYIISGGNDHTEAIMPRQWSHGHSDWRYIYSIQKQFGSRPLVKFPHFSLAQLFYYTVVKKIDLFYILNYIDYDKAEAIKTLEQEVGWRNYGGKHYESVYTRFYQGYILPTKFGIDKRRAHLSTMINAKLVTREEALKELQTTPYPPDLLAQDKEFFLKKMNLTSDEFNQIMESPQKTFWDYPSYEKSKPVELLTKLLRIIRKVTHL